MIFLFSKIKNVIFYFIFHTRQCYLSQDFVINLKKSFSSEVRVNTLAQRFKIKLKIGRSTIEDAMLKSNLM